MPQYYMPMARCRATGQTVKSNDLGSKFSLGQRADAERQAQTLAEQMQYKTGQNWRGFVQLYSVDSQGRVS